MKYMGSIIIILLWWAFVTNAMGQNSKKEYLQKPYYIAFTLSIENPGNMIIKDAEVILDVDSIKKKHHDFNVSGFVIFLKDNEIPSQLIHNDVTGRDEIVLVMDLKPKEKKLLTVFYSKEKSIFHSYNQRAYAELSQKSGGKWINRKYEDGTFGNVKYSRVPSELTDHSYFYRYEGPGWESDKVAYRFYLDWRNAIDITGKKTSEMVLKKMGLDGYESYHNMSDWGMDIFKVGGSLGIGSIAMWSNNKVNMVSKTDSVDCSIEASGPVKAIIKTRYFGWKVDNYNCLMTSNLSIDGGSRITTHDININGNHGELCTGLNKDTVAGLYTDTLSSKKWCYMATWGKQSLAGDSLGIAILFKKNDFVKFAEDAQSHVVVLKPDGNGNLTYKFLAAWEKEPGGLKNEEAFKKYLQEQLSIQDVKVNVKYLDY
jgi:hypothetical protein